MSALRQAAMAFVEADENQNYWHCIFNHSGDDVLLRESNAKHLAQACAEYVLAKFELMKQLRGGP